MSVLIGADEAAVDLFIAKKIDFSDMYYLIEKTIYSHTSINNPSLEEMEKSSKWAIENVYNLSKI
jgi:1-deoxy-D-xylulose 5-phosphate reductoisomerase